MTRFVLVSAASVASGTQRRGHRRNHRRRMAQHRLQPGETGHRTRLARRAHTHDGHRRAATALHLGCRYDHDQRDGRDRQGGPIYVDRPRRHIMDFVHVGNLAHAVERAVAHGRPDGIYYVTEAPRCRSASSSLPYWLLRASTSAAATDCCDAPSHRCSPTGSSPSRAATAATTSPPHGATSDIPPKSAWLTAEHVTASGRRRLWA